MIHLIPHNPKWPEGHLTRHRVLRQAFPDLALITPHHEVPQTDIALVDTALRHTIPDGVKRVLLARGLNKPEPYVPYDLRITWPYEGEPGEVINPLVPVVPSVPRDIDILIIPSRLASFPLQWWQNLAKDIFQPHVLLTPAMGSAAQMIARSRVVVGGGGTGTLYEALWAGCAYVVAQEFTHEQSTRVRLAREAGEPIFENIKAALKYGNTVPRPNGVEELRGLMPSA